MKAFKIFLTLQVISFYFLILPALSQAHAIIIIAPVIAGAAQLTVILLGILSLPVTFISAFINLDKVKESKVKFFLFTLVTWFVILLVVGAISYVVFNIFDINLEIPEQFRDLF